MVMAIPEPKGALPIIGHLHLLRGKTPPFRTLAALADKHGPIFTIRLGTHRALVVSSKETAAECFTVNDRAFLSRPKNAAFDHMGYNGAMSALGPHGKYWAELRRVMTLELLSKRHLETLKRVRTSEVDSCIKELYSVCVNNVGSAIDMIPWFRRVTMNLILRAVAGKRYSLSEVEKDDDDEVEECRRFGRAIQKFMYLAGVFEVSDVIPHVGWMDLQGNLRSMKRIAKEMDYFMSKWLQERVESEESGHVMKEEQDFMDVMLSLFPGDGEVHGHKSKDIVKGTALVHTHSLSILATLGGSNFRRN